MSNCFVFPSRPGLWWSSYIRSNEYYELARSDNSEEVFVLWWGGLLCLQYLSQYLSRYTVVLWYCTITFKGFIGIIFPDQKGEGTRWWRGWKKSKQWPHQLTYHLKNGKDNTVLWVVRSKQVWTRPWSWKWRCAMTLKGPFPQIVFFGSPLGESS